MCGWPCLEAGRGQERKRITYSSVEGEQQMRQVTTEDVAGYLNNNAWRYLEALEVVRQLLIGYRFSEEGRNAIYAIMGIPFTHVLATCRK